MVHEGYRVHDPLCHHLFLRDGEGSTLSVRSTLMFCCMFTCYSCWRLSRFTVLFVFCLFSLRPSTLLPYTKSMFLVPSEGFLHCKIVTRFSSSSYHPYWERHIDLSYTFLGPHLFSKYLRPLSAVRSIRSSDQDLLSVFDLVHLRTSCTRSHFRNRMYITLRYPSLPSPYFPYFLSLHYWDQETLY